jgi:cellulose synthase operon protein C
MGKDRQFSRISVAAGDAAFDRQEWERAETFFKPVVDREPGRYFAVALSGLAHTLYEQKRFEEAARLFERLGESAPEDRKLRSHATYMQALAVRQTGELDAALTLFQRTYERFRMTDDDPDDEALEAGMNAYRAVKGAARAARELDRTAEADRLYENAFNELKLQPEPARQELDLLINEWAELSYNAERYERSDELYALLVRERPESPLADDARLILAESLRFGGKPDEAKTAFRELAEKSEASEFVRQRAFVHLLDLAAEATDWPEVLQVAETLGSEFSESDHKGYVAYRRGEGLLQTGSSSRPRACSMR